MWKWSIVVSINEQGMTHVTIIWLKEVESTNVVNAAPAVEGVTFVTEPPTTKKHHKESSLTDLWEMLVDIQITVNNILLENKKISEDVKELKSTVSKQQTEIADLKKQFKKSTTQLAAAEKELDEAKKRINYQREEIADLQDRLEQYWWTGNPSSLVNGS